MVAKREALPGVYYIFLRGPVRNLLEAPQSEQTDGAVPTEVVLSTPQPTGHYQDPPAIPTYFFLAIAVAFCAKLSPGRLITHFS